MKLTKDFTTLLDKDIARTYITYTVNVLNKNNSIFKVIQYSPSFTIDEIWERTKREFPKKHYQLTFNLK